MEDKIRKIIKNLLITMPEEMNEYEYWTYTITESPENNNKEILYIRLNSSIFNGITSKINEAYLELMPEDSQELNWYTEQIIDYFKFVYDYILLVQF